jgi:hypothetical protein
MSYTLGEAARAVGKSKMTISRAIAAGKISAARNPDGTYSIEPAELHRVFAHVTPESSLGSAALMSRETGAVTAVLRELRDRLADKDAVIDDLRRRLDLADEERRRLALMLTDQRPRRPWWRFWKE